MFLPAPQRVQRGPFSQLIEVSPIYSGPLAAGLYFAPTSEFAPSPWLSPLGEVTAPLEQHYASICMLLMACNFTTPNTSRHLPPPGRPQPHGGGILFVVNDN